MSDNRRWTSVACPTVSRNKSVHVIGDDRTTPSTNEARAALRVTIQQDGKVLGKTTVSGPTETFSELIHRSVDGSVLRLDEACRIHVAAKEGLKQVSLTSLVMETISDDSVINLVSPSSGLSQSMFQALGDSATTGNYIGLLRCALASLFAYVILEQTAVGLLGCQLGHACPPFPPPLFLITHWKKKRET